MGEAPKLNPDLALALTTRGKEPQVVVQPTYICRLEGALSCPREAQKFTIWCMGVFHHLLYSLQPKLKQRLMADLLFKITQMAMVDMSQDSAFALTNSRDLPSL